MFGKILYISDDVIYIENKDIKELNGDLLNIHLIFEHGDQKILGEISKVEEKEIEVKLLGEYVNGHFHNGLLKKASLSSTIRLVNAEELQELIGVKSNKTFLLGKSAVYSEFSVYPDINELFSNHLCIFGNSGSGKSCGVSRIVQNILENDQASAFNANIILFDSFGEYKNAFKDISNINGNYHYKFVTAEVKDSFDEKIAIPLNLLNVDDYAILLRAEKHSQLVLLERALRYARIFSTDTPESNNYKNLIIAKAMMTILYSSDTGKQKKDNIYRILETCHTKEFSFGTEISGIGYTRTISECLELDTHGRFGEEVLITNYILRFIKDDGVNEYTTPQQAFFSLADFAKALDFTLISEGVNQNKNLYDEAQLLKVRLSNIIHSDMGTFFTFDKYYSVKDFVKLLNHQFGNKTQIININLESLDDNDAKSLVKIYSHILFEYAKGNSQRAVEPFHLFLEEAHRYVQKDIDTYLIGYNIFDRIAKEGRKYGVLLNIISQRPVDISDTVISQCSNFLIFKMTHPKDIKYIEDILPNISTDVINKMKVLQSGTCVSFGTAFKIPMISKLDMPNPKPSSSNCNVSGYWSKPLEAQQEETSQTASNATTIATQNAPQAVVVPNAPDKGAPVLQNATVTQVMGDVDTSSEDTNFMMGEILN